MEKQWGKPVKETIDAANTFYTRRSDQIPTETCLRGNPSRQAERRSMMCSLPRDTHRQEASREGTRAGPEHCSPRADRPDQSEQ